MALRLSLHRVRATAPGRHRHERRRRHRGDGPRTADRGHGRRRRAADRAAVRARERAPARARHDHGRRAHLDGSDGARRCQAVGAPREGPAGRGAAGARAGLGVRPALHRRDLPRRRARHGLLRQPRRDDAARHVRRRMARSLDRRCVHGGQPRDGRRSSWPTSRRCPSARPCTLEGQSGPPTAARARSRARAATCSPTRASTAWSSPFATSPTASRSRSGEDRSASRRSCCTPRDSIFLVDESVSDLLLQSRGDHAARCRRGRAARDVDRRRVRRGEPRERRPTAGQPRGDAARRDPAPRGACPDGR